MLARRAFLITLPVAVLLVWGAVAHLQSHKPTRVQASPASHLAAFEERGHQGEPEPRQEDTGDTGPWNCAGQPCEVG